MRGVPKLVKPKPQEMVMILDRTVAVTRVKKALQVIRQGETKQVKQRKESQTLFQERNAEVP